MLTRLFEVLSIDILSNWCDLKTVAKVSSAFCSKNERVDFLCLINNPTFGSTDITYPIVDAFWKWIILNGIKVQHMKGTKSVRYAAHLDCSKVVEFHMEKFKKLNHVVNLINQMSHLKVLRIIEFVFDHDYEYKRARLKMETSLNKFFTLIDDHIWSGLTHLSIVGEWRDFYLDHLDVSKIVSACTQLRSLTVLKPQSGILDHVYVQIIQNNKHLQQLILGDCFCLTPLMRAIKESCAELQRRTMH
jgi:hypothetical protein